MSTATAKKSRKKAGQQQALPKMEDAFPEIPEELGEVAEKYVRKLRFGRDREAVELFRGREMYCLGTCKNGNPRHPLYVKGDVKPVPWVPPWTTDGTAARIAVFGS
jgi:hypothetical protein